MKEDKRKGSGGGGGGGRGGWRWWLCVVKRGKVGDGDFEKKRKIERLGRIEEADCRRICHFMREKINMLKKRRGKRRADVKGSVREAEEGMDFNFQVRGKRMMKAQRGE